MDAPPDAGLSVAPRKTLSVPLPVQKFGAGGDGPHFLGYLASLSETGAFVQSCRPREVGTELSLLLHLPAAREQGMPCVGRIVWTRGYSGPHAPCQGMGILFLGLSEQARRALGRFCLELEAKPGPAPR